MGRLAGLPPPQTIPPSGIICDVWHRRNWQPILNEALGGDNGNDASESEFAGRCCYTRLRGVDRALGCAIVGQDIPYDSRVYCGDAGRGGKEVQYRCIHATRIGRRPNIYHPTIIRPCALRCLYVGAHARVPGTPTLTELRNKMRATWPLLLGTFCMHLAPYSLQRTSSEWRK